MSHIHISVSLLVISLISVVYGEEVRATVNNRGDALAIETNSELVSSSEQVQGVEHVQNTAQCTKDGSMCLSCRSVGMCKGGVMTEVPCRGLYPYCDVRTGSCTNERRRCKEEERSMTCSGPGYFPDPQSCRAFHVCEGNPMVSYKFACAPLQVYDHEEKKCTRPSFRVRCVSFSCFGKQGRFAFYPSDHSIYTLCADAAATGIFKCPEHQEFDETKQKCVPSCTTEDNMADIDDETCRKYYRCVKNGMKFDAVLSNCPGQRVFDTDQLKCVAKTPSFKCSHTNPPPIGAPAPTTSTTPGTNTGNQVSIGETEETFYRLNPQSSGSNNQKVMADEDHGKSASIVGSVHHKSTTETTQTSPLKETAGTTVQSMNGMSTTTKLNDDQKMTLLTAPIINVDVPHSADKPKQIVVRETMTYTPTIEPVTEVPSSTRHSLHNLSGQTYKVTTTEGIRGTTQSTGHNLSGQTYKVTTEEIGESARPTTKSIQEPTTTSPIQVENKPFEIIKDVINGLLPIQIFNTNTPKDTKTPNESEIRQATHSSHSTTNGPTTYTHSTTNGPNTDTHSTTNGPTTDTHSTTNGPTTVTHSTTKESATVHSINSPTISSSTSTSPADTVVAINHLVPNTPKPDH